MSPHIGTGVGVTIFRGAGPGSPGKEQGKHVPPRRFVCSSSASRSLSAFCRTSPKFRSCRKTRSKPACTAWPTPSSKASRRKPMDVEILGVLRDMAGPKSDVILARLHGKKVEYTGVVAGMSGSPVYIDGKLVGAIAYRIGEFSKEPIAGITPRRPCSRSMPWTSHAGADVAQAATAAKSRKPAAPPDRACPAPPDQQSPLRESAEAHRHAAGLHRIQPEHAAALLQGLRLRRRRAGDGRRLGQQRQAAGAAASRARRSAQFWCAAT